MVEDNYVRRGKVVYIVDGDTFDMDVDLGFYVTVRIRIRVKGIDAPEMKGITREDALVSKAFLEQNLLNNQVRIVSTKQNSFRRWLADVYYNVDGIKKSLADEVKCMARLNSTFSVPLLQQTPISIPIK